MAGASEEDDEDAEPVDPVVATEWLFATVDADGDDVITLRELKDALNAAKAAGKLTGREKRVILAYFRGDDERRELSKQEVLFALTMEIPEWLDADFMGGSDDEGEDEADEEDETDD